MADSWILAAGAGSSGSYPTQVQAQAQVPAARRRQQELQSPLLEFIQELLEENYDGGSHADLMAAGQADARDGAPAGGGGKLTVSAFSGPSRAADDATTKSATDADNRNDNHD
eukprot:4354894-Pyramimonas_sp.AAC.1